MFQKRENRMYMNTSIAEINLCKGEIDLDFSSFLCFVLFITS